MKENPVETAPAILTELQNLTKKKVFTGRHLHELSDFQRKRILRSQMNITRKVAPNSDGTGRAADKVKARLVAGGDGQDRNMYSRSETSSPTATTSGLAIVLMLAAERGCHCVTADVGCAYLNAAMPKGDAEKLVFIKIAADIASTLIKVDPSMEAYVRADGTLIVELNQALYGCVESAQLWYTELTDTLKALGFRMNDTDPCILNRTDNGIQITVVIYVDDLLMACIKSDPIDDLISALREKYEDIKVVTGKTHNYLGMVIDFSTPHVVTLNQTGMVLDIITTTRAAVARAQETGSKVPPKIRSKAPPKTPAAPYLFDCSQDSQPLPESLKTIYHSTVAKLIFLSNRTRADILTTVSFLSKKVLHPTLECWGKLTRVLSYLEETKDLKLTLGATFPLVIRTYIDASFAVHPDSKSHTGVCVSLGIGCFYAKSTGQKINTTSSCQAELVAAAKGLQQSIFSAYFLEGQGHPRPPIIVHQDNQSTIKLIHNGRSNSDLTRHIAIGYYWLKDLIERGIIKVVYCPTEEMVADIFTKPLQGSTFEYFRGKIMGASPITAHGEPTEK